MMRGGGAVGGNVKEAYRDEMGTGTRAGNERSGCNKKKKRGEGRRDRVRAKVGRVPDSCSCDL